MRERRDRAVGRRSTFRGGAASLCLAAAVALAVALAGALGSPLSAAEVEIEGQLLYEIADGVFVGTAKDAPLRKGEIGWLERDGKAVVRVEVANISSGSAFLRILGPRPVDFPRSGDAVALRFSREAEADGPRSRAPSPTLKDRNGADAPAAPLGPGEVIAPPIEDPNHPNEGPAKSGTGTPPAIAKPPRPLLAAEKSEIGAFTDAFNIFKGQVSFRETFQLSSNDRLNYSVTHLRSSGSLERVEGTPWTLEWSGDISYREGRALENVQDYRTARIEAYQFSFFRRFDDQSWVRVGRLLPRELPSVGYLDGAQGEWHLNEAIRIGGIVGFKADRDGLDFTFREPTHVAYVTLQAGDGADVAYTGTLGLLSSLYDGTFDRLAFLADQSLRWKKLSLLSSSEIDFDVGGTEARSGTRLTRWDLLATYPLGPRTTLRGGLDRYETPDTEAQRAAVDALLLDETEFFDRGYWRYFVGASHDLSPKWRLSEEVMLIDSPPDSGRIRWNASLTKSAVRFLTPNSSLTLTAYNYQSRFLDGYGARLSGYIPLPGGRVSLQPDVAFRFLQTDLHGNQNFTFTDAALRVYWRLNQRWSASGGFSYAVTEDAQRFLVDLGVTFKW